MKVLKFCINLLWYVILIIALDYNYDVQQQLSFIHGLCCYDGFKFNPHDLCICKSEKPQMIVIFFILVYSLNLYKLCDISLSSLFFKNWFHNQQKFGRPFIKNLVQFLIGIKGPYKDIVIYYLLGWKSWAYMKNKQIKGINFTTAFLSYLR